MQANHIYTCQKNLGSSNFHWQRCILHRRWLYLRYWADDASTLLFLHLPGSGGRSQCYLVLKGCWGCDKSRSKQSWRSHDNIFCLQKTPCQAFLLGSICSHDSAGARSVPWSHYGSFGQHVQEGNCRGPWERLFEDCCEKPWKTSKKCGVSGNGPLNRRLELFRQQQGRGGGHRCQSWLWICTCGCRECTPLPAGSSVFGISWNLAHGCQAGSSWAWAWRHDVVWEHSRNRWENRRETVQTSAVHRDSHCTKFFRTTFFGL